MDSSFSGCIINFWYGEDMIMKHWKKVIFTLAILSLIGISWVVYMYHSIIEIGEQSVPEQADVIIVLGAAVWQDGPSPALRARVNHAFEVYESGYATEFILSGGLGHYEPTEAEAMMSILIDYGVPSDQLHLETEATNTRENIEFSHELMKQNNWESAIVVTDVFHIKRTLLICNDESIECYGSPAKNSVLYTNQSLKLSYTLREVVAITQHYIFSFL